MTALTVEKIFPMAEDAKSGGLKATNGNIYKFLPWQAKFIKEGAELDVPIVESPYNGKTYLWFAKTWPSKDDQNAARTEQPRQSAPPPAANGHAPASNGYGSAKDVQITAIALMKSYIETGKFGLTDLPVLEAACIPAAKRIVSGSQ